MAKNLLVINVDIRETRVALIENGIIAELHIERESSQGTLGNIYVGKVSRVLPGMQAAFIDVGLERAAFLHVEDLIRPSDFEAYLSGKRSKQDEERKEDTDGSVSAEDAEAAEPEEPAEVVVAPEGDLIGGAQRPPPRAPVIEEAAAIEASVPAPEDDDDDEIVAPPSRHVVEARASDPGGADEDAHAADEDEAHLHEHEGDDEHDEPAADHGDADDDDGDRDSDDDAPNDDEPAADEADDDERDDEDHDREDLSALGDEEARAEKARDATAPMRTGPPAGSGAEVEDAEAASDVERLDPVYPPGERPEQPVDAVAAVAADANGDQTPEAGRARSRSRRSRRSGRTRDRRPETVDAAARPAEPRPSAAPAPREGGDRGRGRGGRDRGRGGDQQQARGGGGGGGDRGGRNRDRGRGGRERSGGGGGGRRNEPLRVSKTTPIRDVVREGQEVIVQISKEPIGTKGARVTSHVSLPGRYVVYLPTVEHVGISKRIGNDKERQRLREAIDAMKPPTGGIVVRTLGEGLTKKQLKADIGYLVRIWGEVAKKRESGEKAPACLYQELDLILKTARDLFSEDIEKIVIDDREQYVRLKRFVEMFMPERADAVELYEGAEPIFDAYGIEDEIQRALARKVPLPSGGYLIIDQAEALTAIDVNTGRYVGKGSKDLEDTILATNLEAVEEIAYQLRFRNLGGLIILDLIDMERTGNREKVRRKLEQLLEKDKAKTTLNRISDLGLIEMTRKRTRESLGRTILEPCFYCDGTGQLQSKQTIAYEILRQIRRERLNLPGYVVIVNAHPAVIDLLKNDEREAVTVAEKLFQRRIDLVPRKEYHMEQFDLQGR